MRRSPEAGEMGAGKEFGRPLPPWLRSAQLECYISPLRQRGFAYVEDILECPEEVERVSQCALPGQRARMRRLLIKERSAARSLRTVAAEQQSGKVDEPGATPWAPPRGTTLYTPPHHRRLDAEFSESAEPTSPEHPRRKQSVSMANPLATLAAATQEAACQPRRTAVPPIIGLSQLSQRHDRQSPRENRRASTPPPLLQNDTGLQSRRAPFSRSVTARAHRTGFRTQSCGPGARIPLQRSSTLTGPSSGSLRSRSAPAVPRNGKRESEVPARRHKQDANRSCMSTSNVQCFGSRTSVRRPSPPPLRPQPLTGRNRTPVSGRTTPPCGRRPRAVQNTPARTSAAVAPRLTGKRLERTSSMLSSTTRRSKPTRDPPRASEAKPAPRAERQSVEQPKALLSASHAKPQDKRPPDPASQGATEGGKGLRPRRVSESASREGTPTQTAAAGTTPRQSIPECAAGVVNVAPSGNPVTPSAAVARVSGMCITPRQPSFSPGSVSVGLSPATTAVQQGTGANLPTPASVTCSARQDTARAARAPTATTLCTPTVTARDDDSLFVPPMSAESRVHETSIVTAGRRSPDLSMLTSPAPGDYSLSDSEPNSSAHLARRSFNACAARSNASMSLYQRVLSP